jgi:hypothetical protein
MSGGRPSKLPDSKELILEAIRAGCYAEQAAEAAGVSKSSFYAWQARGERESEGIYHDFVVELRKAEAEAELSAVRIVRSAIEDELNPRIALAFLERRFPKRWRRHQTSELVGRDGGPIQTEQSPPLDLSRLSNEELAELRRLYERAAPESDRG